jgi:hypothetical protein
VEWQSRPVDAVKYWIIEAAKRKISCERPLRSEHARHTSTAGHFTVALGSVTNEEGLGGINFCKRHQPLQPAWVRLQYAHVARAHDMLRFQSHCRELGFCWIVGQHSDSPAGALQSLKQTVDRWITELSDQSQGSLLDPLGSDAPHNVATQTVAMCHRGDQGLVETYNLRITDAFTLNAIGAQHSQRCRVRVAETV